MNPDRWRQRRSSDACSTPEGFGMASSLEICQNTSLFSEMAGPHTIALVLKVPSFVVADCAGIRGCPAA